jgi:hypothetical protein
MKPMQKPLPAMTYSALTVGLINTDNDITSAMFLSSFDYINCTSNGMFLYVLYFKTSHTIYGSCDTAFSMGWTIQRLNPRKDKRFFSSPKCLKTLSHLPSFLYKSGSFPKGKSKADHSPSSRAKVE